MKDKVTVYAGGTAVVMSREDYEKAVCKSEGKKEKQSGNGSKK